VTVAENQMVFLSGIVPFIPHPFFANHPREFPPSETASRFRLRKRANHETFSRARYLLEKGRPLMRTKALMPLDKRIRLIDGLVWASFHSVR
jgi:hypothetical protein